MQVWDVFMWDSWVCLWAWPVSVSGPGAALGRELRVAGGRKPPSQVLEDVEGQAAHQGDDSDLPQERQGGNEVNICVERRAQSQKPGKVILGKGAELQLHLPELPPAHHGTGLELDPSNPDHSMILQFLKLPHLHIQGQSPSDTWFLTPLPFSCPEAAEMC